MLVFDLFVEEKRPCRLQGRQDQRVHTLCTVTVSELTLIVSITIDHRCQVHLSASSGSPAGLQGKQGCQVAFSARTGHLSRNQGPHVNWGTALRSRPIARKSVIARACPASMPVSACVAAPNVETFAWDSTQSFLWAPPKRTRASKRTASSRPATARVRCNY